MTFCDNCGAKISGNALFCEACGAKLAPGGASTVDIQTLNQAARHSNAGFDLFKKEQYQEAAAEFGQAIAHNPMTQHSGKTGGKPGTRSKTTPWP